MLAVQSAVLFIFFKIEHILAWFNRTDLLRTRLQWKNIFLFLKYINASDFNYMFLNVIVNINILIKIDLNLVHYILFWEYLQIVHFIPELVSDYISFNMM